MELKRVENWRDRLTDLINEKRQTYFEWGTHDCALWAADCIKAITGEDFASDIRGTYTTPEGAFKGIIKVYGVYNVKDIFIKLFGEVRHIAYARPGDIVFQNSNYAGFNAAVGVCYGKQSYFITEDDEGLLEYETLDLHGCFWIG